MSTNWPSEPPLVEPGAGTSRAGEGQSPVQAPRALAGYRTLERMSATSDQSVDLAMSRDSPRCQYDVYKSGRLARRFKSPIATLGAIQYPSCIPATSCLHKAERETVKGK